jgi:hypothetical protein
MIDSAERAWSTELLAGGCVLYQHPRFRWHFAVAGCTQETPLTAAREGAVMPFGKYRGAPLTAVVDDVAYAEWLLAQTWFGEKFPRQHSYLADALARSLADAEGDPAGRRRDDGPEAA